MSIWNDSVQSWGSLFAGILVGNALGTPFSYNPLRDVGIRFLVTIGAAFLIAMGVDRARRPLYEN